MTIGEAWCEVTGLFLPNTETAQNLAVMGTVFDTSWKNPIDEKRSETLVGDDEISRTVAIPMMYRLARILVHRVCRPMSQPPGGFTSPEDPRAGDVEKILTFVRERLGIQVDGNAFDCQVPLLPEFQKPKSVGEVIDRLRKMVSAGICVRCFDGRVWNEIVAMRDKPLDEIIEMEFAFAPYRVRSTFGKKLAAFIINIVCDGLTTEYRMSTSLTAREAEEIDSALRNLVKFVQQDLGVPVFMQSGRPHVNLD